jgi:UDP-perosamine 4-acetyltransferase
MRCVMLGAGGHAAVVLRAALLAMPNLVCEKALVTEMTSAEWEGISLVLESDTTPEGLLAEGITHALVGIGCVKAAPWRWLVLNRYLQAGIELLSVIHPTALVDATASIEPGCFIGAASVIQPYASIGAGSIVNTGAIVEHHSEVGRNCHVAPGAILCGQVSLGDHAFVGAGAVVIQNQCVETETTIPAGMVVRDSVRV